MTDPTSADSLPPVRLALLGCGRVAARVHLPILRGLAGVKVTAVAEPEASNAAVADKLFPGVRRFESYEALLADAADVDAVVVTLPTPMHASVGEAVLKAGKDLYLEKPIAIDAEGAARVLAAAAAAGRVAMTGLNYRFQPLFNDLAAVVRSGTLGRLVSVRTQFTTAARQLPAWKQSRATGGGALLDLASHHLDLLRHLFDLDVTAATASVRSLGSEDDTAEVRWSTASGVGIQSLFSMSSVEQDRIEYFGDKGAAWADRFDAAGAVHVTPVRRGADRSSKLWETAADATSLASRLWRVVRPAYEPSHRLALAHFVDCVRSRATPKVTLEDGWSSLAGVLAAEASAASGRVESLASSPAAGVASPA